MRAIKSSRKIFLLITAIAALSLLITIAGCKKDNPVVPPETPVLPKDTLNLNIESVTHRSISIDLRASLYKPETKTIRLFRELNSTKSLVTELHGTTADTTIIDDDNGAGLLLDTAYTYFAISEDSTGNAKDTSNFVTAKTLAPTSHDYTWEEFTIGDNGSYLKDVWGTDDNNVWAVGTFTIDGVPYGIIKWDGTEWKPDKKNGGQAAIYGFSDSDIWTVGGGVFHYNGSEWIRIDAKGVNNQSIPLDTVLNDNLPYTSVWGTSSSNLYLGNQWGKIIHWDGEKAEVIYDFGIWITDINGTSADNIWFTAEVEDIIIANYNGISFDIIKYLPSYQHPLYTIYPINKKQIYLGGKKIFIKEQNKWVIAVDNIDRGVIYKIRGTGANNIFAVGAFNAVYHFNGQDWKFYNELFTKGAGTAEGVFATSDKVFIVGRNADYTKAKILIGIKN